jgi:hypothetical protein
MGPLSTLAGLGTWSVWRATALPSVPPVEARPLGRRVDRGNSSILGTHHLFVIRGHITHFGAPGRNALRERIPGLGSRRCPRTVYPSRRCSAPRRSCLGESGSGATVAQTV